MAVLALLLACLGWLACGGSSKSSSTSTNAAAIDLSRRKISYRPFRVGRRPLRSAARMPAQERDRAPETYPRPATRSRAVGFLGGAGGPRLPAGVTRAQYEAAMKKCGGAAFVGSGARIKSPPVKQALAKFSACMRQNGVNLPATEHLRQRSDLQHQGTEHRQHPVQSGRGQVHAVTCEAPSAAGPRRRRAARGTP